MSTQERQQEGTSGATVRILRNGPFLVEGIAIYDAEGKRIGDGERAALCRCGLSGNKPFCDGSHHAGFQG